MTIMREKKLFTIEKQRASQIVYFLLFRKKVDEKKKTNGTIREVL